MRRRSTSQTVPIRGTGPGGGTATSSDLTVRYCLD